jgi:hypothetical protein
LEKDYLNLPAKDYEQFKETLKKSSPFTSYYENMIAIHKNGIKNIDERNITNAYYSPKHFELIMKILHIMPLWSGCMIHVDLHSNFDISSRLTNNNVENYFGYVKNKLLNRKRDLLSSEYVAPSYKRLKSIFFEFHRDCIQNKKLPAFFENKFEEKWTDSKTKKALREKSYFYNKSTKDIFNSMPKNQSNIEINECFIQAFEPAVITERRTNLINICETSLEMIILKDIYLEVENASYDKIISIFESKREVIESAFNKLTNLKFEVFYQMEECDCSFDEIILANALKNFNAVKVPGDGNCFYYSIAKLFLGDIKYFIIIKLVCHFAIVKNRKCFETILKLKKYGISLTSFLENSLKKKSWSNHLNILGTSFALKRPIYTFSINTEKYPEVKVFSHPSSIKNKPLLIAFNINHFTPLVANDENSKIVQLDNVDNQEILNDFDLI